MSFLSHLYPVELFFIKVILFLKNCLLKSPKKCLFRKPLTLIIIIAIIVIAHIVHHHASPNLEKKAN